MTTFAEVIDFLSTRLQIDLRPAVNAGGCSIQLDDQMEIHLECSPNNSEIFVHSALVPLPSRKREIFYSKLLELHLFGVLTSGAIFSLDLEHERVLIFKIFAFETMDLSRFLSALEEFVRTVNTMRPALHKLTDELDTEFPSYALDSSDHMKRV
jgi:hypothetical protein